MSFLVLFNSSQSWLASEQRVFSADDVVQVSTAIELVSAMNDRLQQQAIDTIAAHKEGYRDGYQEGRLQAESRGNDKLAENLLKQQKQLQEHLNTQRAAIVDLALEITRKIAGEVGPDAWLLAQATHAADALTGSVEGVLVVHPSRVAGVSERVALLPDSPFTSVVGNEELSLDACTIETPGGCIKLSSESQLAELQQVLGCDDELDDTTVAASQKVSA